MKSPSIPSPLEIEIEEWPAGHNSYLARMRSWAHRSGGEGEIPLLTEVLQVLHHAEARIQKRLSSAYARKARE